MMLGPPHLLGRGVSYDKNGILVPSSCLTDPHFDAAPGKGAAFLIRTRIENANHAK